MRAKFIYLIENKINNKCYVGYHSTTDVNDRYFGSGKLIKRAVKKYGRKNFSKQILEYLNENDNWEEKEIHWINEMNTKYPNGYNLTDGGEGGIGKIFSEKTKKLMSKTRKERQIAVGKNNGMFGRYHTKQSREKIKKTREERNCGKGHNNARFDNNTYKFYNTKTQQIYEGHKYDLAQIINSRGSALNAVINGSRKHHKNWIVI